MGVVLEQSKISIVLNAGGLRRGGLGRRRGVGRRVGRRGRTRRGERRRRGQRKDLLAELVGLEEEPGPVLAQVLEQVLELPLQARDLALGEVRLGEELRQLDEEADEVLGACVEINQ